MIMQVQTALTEDTVDEVVAKHELRTGDVLGVLEELQRRHPQRYLPRQTLELVARKLGVSASRVFSVATFYSFFNLEPQGEHTLMVCRGTACHTRGSKTLLDRIRSKVELIQSADGETYTTPDHKLTLRTVACFGQCALAPVVGLDEKIYSYMTEVELNKLLNSLAKK